MRRDVRLAEGGGGGGSGGGGGGGGGGGRRWKALDGRRANEHSRARASATIRHGFLDIGIVLHGFHDRRHATTTCEKASKSKTRGKPSASSSNASDSSEWSA